MPKEPKTLDALLEKAQAIKTASNLSAVDLMVDGSRRNKALLERYGLYAALFPFKKQTYWYLLLLLSASVWLTLVFTAPQYIDAPYGQIVTGAFVLSAAKIMATYAIHLYRFFGFRRWRRNLNFRLVGWEKLITPRNFPNFRYWRLNCRIDIHFRYGFNTHNEMVEAILFMFMSEANHCGYPLAHPIVGFEKDPRKSWKLQNATLTGSINCHVARQVYEMCQHIQLLNKKEPCIESLLITVDEQAYFLKPSPKF